ncbi:hypothetical protein GN956_G9690 [Arapaima gigas]
MELLTLRPAEPFELRRRTVVLDKGLLSVVSDTHLFSDSGTRGPDPRKEPRRSLRGDRRPERPYGRRAEARRAGPAVRGPARLRVAPRRPPHAKTVQYRPSQAQASLGAPASLVNAVRAPRPGGRAVVKELEPHLQGPREGFPAPSLGKTVLTLDCLAKVSSSSVGTVLICNEVSIHKE